MMAAVLALVHTHHEMGKTEKVSDVHSFMVL